MVHSLLSNSYCAVCLRNPPSGSSLLPTSRVGPGSLICERCTGEWVFEDSEVKEDSLKLALAALSMHVLQVTSVSSLSVILHRDHDKCDGSPFVQTNSSEKDFEMDYRMNLNAITQYQHGRC